MFSTNICSVPANSRSCTIHITDGVDSTRGGGARGLGGDAADQDDDRRQKGEQPVLHDV